MSIPQTFIQELIARADVVEIVGRYVPLKKGGANFMGLCPFHSEKSPSFTVSPSKQFFHCFGCGKNGNAIGFLMEHAGMSFVEAVQDLAQQYGMQVPQDDASPEDRARTQERREKQHTLSSVLEKAALAYRQQLKTSPRAIAYLKGRGLSGDVARQFGLGYAPEGWRSLASVFPHYDDPLLVESGLVIAHTEEEGGDTKRYDRFRDRVMFPIRNVKGECIGFGGRVLSSPDAAAPGAAGPKYLNSPETPVFSKGQELYGLFEARNALRDQGYALVTEGYMDVVALAQLGFPNAIATLGTACTQDHLQKLFRFTDAVVFSFDGDNAGRRAARKALGGAVSFASDVRSIKFLFLPPEHDPDSFIRAHGKEAFARFVTEATPLSRFLIESAREGCELQSAEGRAHLASNAKPLWLQLPEGALKIQLLSEIATLAQLDSRELSALWLPASSFPGQTTPRRASGSPPTTTRRYGGARLRPATRADHATRILFGQSALWDTLSGEDHSMLCALPAPHGPLFIWLEGQLHDHGSLPWAYLRELLQAHPMHQMALSLMAEISPSATAAQGSEPGNEHGSAQDGQSNEAELRDLLNRMLIERIKQQETETIAASKADPAALARYRELQARRRQLEQVLQQTPL